MFDRIDKKYLILVGLLSSIAILYFTVNSSNTQNFSSSNNTLNSTSNGDAVSKFDNNIQVTQDVKVINDQNKFNDGKYTISITYNVPKNYVDTIIFTFDLKDDFIQNVDFSANASNEDSRRYINLFGKNYKPLVLGKKLDDLSLSNVAGASLTTQAFNESLSKLKQQAQK